MLKTISPATDEGALACLRGALAQRIASGSLELPILPEVAGRVLALARDEKSDATSLSLLIQRDQGLAGHVMRVANSAMYAPRTAIQSLQQAIARLGMAVVGEIALSVSLQSRMFKVPGHEALIRSLWRHAAASGSWGKEIARLRRRNVESAFLCGLLHAIGKPIVLQALVQLSDEQKVPLLPEDSRILIDEQHVEVGARMAEQWQLPVQVREAIRFNQRYGDAPAFREEAMTTHLAALLATHLLDAQALDEERLRGAAVLVDLNLYPEDVGALLACRDSVRSVVEAMSL